MVINLASTGTGSRVIFGTLWLLMKWTLTVLVPPGESVISIRSSDQAMRGWSLLLKALGAEQSIVSVRTKLKMEVRRSLIEGHMEDILSLSSYTCLKQSVNSLDLLRDKETVENKELTLTP